MKTIIETQDLTRIFRTYKKREGLKGSVIGLFKREYTEKKAAYDLNFKIEEGEIVAFLGPNGAGKTTTLKMLSGLLHPTSGEAQVLGYRPWKREYAFLKQVSLVMGQRNQLWWDLPAIESFNLQRDIYEVPNEAYRKRLDELVELLDLSKILNTAVRKLSLGERMKCEMVAALLHRPKVLLLDEPTIGLDVVMQKKIRNFIKDYNREHGATILLTSHYMEDVAALAKRALVINFGRPVYEGSLDALTEKYAPNKLLVVSFMKVVESAELAPIGQVISNESGVIRIQVPRNSVAERASALFNRFPVADLSIEEPQLDDIIHDLFTDTSHNESEKIMETAQPRDQLAAIA
ncbi:MAG: ATP-binding cassette domain-containing protein [Chloroflexi bacterium]|uniref:ATP-binding cassette domain-containing protein n=1 Tax=Candidatus Chlorohelix allophototropha TaxID=3003348 RepID=A0A8T7M408_9CHLR|nr:ATP-binding cassette domain-containing protein [Chloroflexota bacterium]WJW70207.1 ATP-binding cassette domain-containing protein [Chloroflexota bacterium L227-S17]